MLFQSTLNAFMKLVTINDVYVKAFGKHKMANYLEHSFVKLFVFIKRLFV